MARLVHLVRHGEVHNPGHLIYANLPGFRLSRRGRVQAEEAADHLARRPVTAVWSSPLERALETAEAIARRFRTPVRVEPDLVEWRAAEGWAGITWEELGVERPDELEGYLERPHEFDFLAEPLSALAERMGGAVRRLSERHPDGEIVVVGHQDPIQAARLALTGRTLSELHVDKPTHASVLTLRPDHGRWREEALWRAPSSDPDPWSLTSPGDEPAEQLGVGLEGEDG